MSFDMDKELASYVLRHDGSYCFTGTLLESIGTVALRSGIGDLDEIGLDQVRVLSYLCEYDDYRGIASVVRAFDDNENLVESTLQLLIQLGFVVKRYSEFKATDKGRSVIYEVAIEVIKFDRFKYQQSLQEVNDLMRKCCAGDN